MQLELHVLLEDELHLLGLLEDVLVGEAAFEQVARLLLVVLAPVLDLHVHVDRPDVHALGVVAHDALEHRAPVLRLPVLELEHAEFGDQPDMAVLRQRLQCPLEHLLRLRGLKVLNHDVLGRTLVFLVATHLEEEFYEAAPYLQRGVVLLAQLLVDVLNVQILLRVGVHVDQLQVNLLSIVDLEGSLDHALHGIFISKIILQIHVGHPDIELILLAGHGHALDGPFCDPPCRLDAEVVKDEGHVLNPDETLVLVRHDHPLVVVDGLRLIRVIAHVLLLLPDLLLLLDPGLEGLLAALAAFLLFFLRRRLHSLILVLSFFFALFVVVSFVHLLVVILAVRVVIVSLGLSDDALHLFLVAVVVLHGLHVVVVLELLQVLELLLHLVVNAAKFILVDLLLGRNLLRCLDVFLGLFFNRGPQTVDGELGIVKNRSRGLAYKQTGNLLLGHFL